MELAEEIGRYGSVAIAGLAKNTGKTVTLNHLLREGHRKGMALGVTSIGIDGESIDLVSATAKPEIRLYSGMRFATSEAHFRRRKMEAEVTSVTSRHTSLGRVVTGRALADGKMLLSGPPDTASMRDVIGRLHADGARTVLVDGALSRLSLASPVVTDALVLATGAALSPDIRTIVAKTAFICRLAALPEVGETVASRLNPLAGDIYALDGDDNPVALGIGSALNLEKAKDKIFLHGTTIYNPGVVSEKFMRFLMTGQRQTAQADPEGIHLLIRDFTRLFVDPQTFAAFIRSGGRISVLRRASLLALTVNPYSPAGYTVDRHRLVAALEERIKDIPIIYIDPYVNPYIDPSK